MNRQVTLLTIGIVAVASNYNIPKQLVSDVFTHYVPNVAALSGVGLLNAVSPITPVDYAVDETIPGFLKLVQDRYFDGSPPDARFVYRNTVPAILNVPYLERIEFFVFRFWNYFALKFINLPYNIWYGLWNYKTTPVEDGELGALFSHHWPSSFLKTLDFNSPPHTAEGLPEFIHALNVPKQEVNRSEWYVAQFPGMAHFAYRREHNKMFYGAGSFIVLRRPKGSTQDLEPYAIELFGECMEDSPHNDGNHPKYSSIIVHPGDPAWTASKTFVIHGAQHYYVLAEHPMAHFPMDIVNAGTKDRRLLPVYHPIQTLLKPHFRFSLTLNDFVMNSFATSILLNENLVHCFDASGPEIFQLAQEFTLKYNFKDHEIKKFPPSKPSNMSVFLLEYRPIIEKFVRKVVEAHADTGEFKDVYVQKWADYISEHIPGFPTGEEIKKQETLIDTLTEIIFDLSVHHSTQHWNYHTAFEMKKRPWRIRHRPPLSKDEEWDFEKGTQTRKDMLIYADTEIMFFYAGPYNSLKDTRYEFEDETIQEYAKAFTKELKAKDKQLADTGFPVYQLAPLSKLGPSIDY